MAFNTSERAAYTVCRATKSLRVWQVRIIKQNRETKTMRRRPIGWQTMWWKGSWTTEIPIEASTFVFPRTRAHRRESVLESTASMNFNWEIVRSARRLAIESGYLQIVSCGFEIYRETKWVEFVVNIRNKSRSQMKSFAFVVKIVAPPRYRGFNLAPYTRERNQPPCESFVLHFTWRSAVGGGRAVCMTEMTCSMVCRLAERIQFMRTRCIANAKQLRSQTLTRALTGSSQHLAVP